MFSGPSAGGLQAGPTAGSISTNPAAYIPIAGLAVEQVAELRGELQDKHPLLTAATPLGQNLVSGLPDSLAARATTSQLSQGLAAKQDVRPCARIGNTTTANVTVKPKQSQEGCVNNSWPTRRGGTN